MSVLIASFMIVKAQTVPVFNYTHPSLEEIKKLAGSYDEKGHAFYLYLQETINMKLADTTWKVSDSQQLGLDSIFKYISQPEEIPFKDGSWLNSGYNIYEKKMDPSIGKNWIGFCWMFKIGSYSFPIMKEDCANIIRSISFYAPRYLDIDILAFKKRLDEITNNFNFLSIRVEKNTNELEALKAEIAGIREGQKAEVNQLKHFMWRMDQESQLRDYRLKAGLNAAAAAISAGGTALLWYSAFHKHWEEDDITREIEADYTYWQYTLEKEEYIPLPQSSGKSSKSGSTGVPTISSSYTNRPKPEINFAGSAEYCGGGNDHGNNHNNCPDNGDVTNIYNIINNIFNMITNNEFVTNNFYEYVTNNISVFQDFVNNYYTTNNYYEYVTKIEQIFNTYNTYVYNTYVTNVTNNTYVVATYSLRGEMKTGKIKAYVIDRGMVRKENSNKGWCILGGIIGNAITYYFVDKAFENLKEAHNIRVTLTTDLRQMYTSQIPDNSLNVQASVTKYFDWERTGRKHHQAWR
jgi:hypothetical protein